MAKGKSKKKRINRIRLLWLPLIAICAFMIYNSIYQPIEEDTTIHPTRPVIETTEEVTYTNAVLSDEPYTEPTEEVRETEENKSSILESFEDIVNNINDTNDKTASYTLRYEDIPEYNGHSHIIINNNTPSFSSKEITNQAFEKYGELDSLNRCTAALASLCKETMPEKYEERGKIGMIKPSGWKTQKYDNVDGKYLFNRCHLIGWQLGAENANEKNLVTGTRYMNLEMLEYENMVATYIKNTGNHVMYRVTPIFNGDELICRGLQMEGYSVEDQGAGICFNVFYYNVQPDIEINYFNGDSRYIGE